MNKKIYKGYELIEAIANKKIKDYTRIIPHYPNNDCTVEYLEYSNGFIHDDKHSNDVNVCIFLNNDRTFEILEDNTEEIEELQEFDIQGLEVSGYSMTQAEYLLEDGINENRDKINEIIRYIKRKDKNND